MPLNPDQIAIRRTGVTASEIAAVAGLSPWEGPHDVWARKLGLIDGPADSYHMERGRYRQHGTLRWMAHRLDVHIDMLERTIVCADDPLVIATPDGHAYHHDANNPYAVVEVKSPGRYAEKDWQNPEDVPDGIPIYVVPQVIWQMAAEKLDQALVGAEIRDDLYTYQIAWNQKLYDNLRDLVSEFWRYVQLREPPPMDIAGPSTTTNWVRKFYSTQKSDDMLTVNGDIDTELSQHALDYVTAKDEIKAAKKKVERAAAKIQYIIGEHAGVQGDEWLATWKQNKSSIVVDFKSICEEIQPPKDIIQKHTHEKPGNRPFHVRFKKED